ncbi:uncharacterized protein LOC106143413 [Amyelois transitella]|uniref:uncharacterized protein LOC106143413 n=1 Tax=Amyelois transitella TaxID=680683 RepID=UPI00298FA967|nr:uncharacterized protein LOC106143413 [Amyelois transitella]
MPSNRVCLLEEYRLIEKSEHEVNGIWKGAHILLFFLAFVFGCFCTFCFHMLMYMFDEKCVLFPKLQSLTSLRHNVIYEFIPIDKDSADMPVDFLSTQWLEKSACYLPTYVPLVSAIFGLVWTTMFLMCSTGSRTLSGLQRPWRILPPVFIFSLAMGGVCIYSSSMTHNGLEELCLKLSEITGSPTCTYTVNVATLVYERRIRGVYQATRLTILTAWLHTFCWLMSAVLALARIIMVVDFQLVRINVDLIGDTDKMLEKKETHVRTVSPDRWLYTSNASLTSVVSTGVNKVQFKSKLAESENKDKDPDNTTNMMCMLYYDDKPPVTRSTSNLSLVPEERIKLAKKRIFVSIKKEHYFIAQMVFDLVNNLKLPESPVMSIEPGSPPSLVLEVVRQFGHSRITSLTNSRLSDDNAEEQKKIIERLWPREKTNLFESRSEFSVASSSRGKPEPHRDSIKKGIVKSTQVSNKKDKEWKGEDKSKSSMKHVSIQTDKKRKRRPKEKAQNVKDNTSDTSLGSNEAKASKESQTDKKEKQD